MGEGSNVLNETMLTNINQTMTTLGTELGEWGATLLPIIGTVVGVFILFWVFKLGMRIIKSFANTSK